LFAQIAAEDRRLAGGRVAAAHDDGRNGTRIRRLLDVVGSVVGLVASAPFLAIAVLGIRVSSPGPLIYRALRVGRHGRPFTMYKLRTMHVGNASGRSAITAANDRRVFPFGKLLRQLKIDELPQLLNVLRGDMAIVGPRPEDPRIVEFHYGELGRESLTVRPGLASPGSLYYYTHHAASGEEDDYVRRLLELKLAIEVIYVRQASLGYDIRIVGRTLSTLVAVLLGRRRFDDPPELAAAERLVADRSSTTPEHATAQIA